MLDNIQNPAVMGILNVTPDSFSDGGKYNHLDRAISRAHEMIEAGADIIDIGGESTRPGAVAVSVEEELARVIPVVERLRQSTDIAISIDTSTPAVMREAAKFNVDMINDVRALQREGALAAAADIKLPVCLMHMQGRPDTMQLDPQYLNILTEITVFFQARISACESAGITRDRILLDPGFGFGKTPEHNLMLINRLTEFKTFGMPLVVGLSRKSTLNKIGRLSDNLMTSIAGAIISVINGAAIVRVHDVAETAEALSMLAAVTNEQLSS